MMLRRAALCCITAFSLLIGLHWFLLDYPARYGGQQEDDDYHYYGFAARFSAADPFDLPAYRAAGRPDRLNASDEARLNISFSNAMPYPLWAYAVHVLTAWTGMSYPMAAFALYVVQAALLVFGSLLVARASGGSLVAGSAAIVLFLGVDPFPSPLLSIPMNAAAALCVAALGLLLHGWKRAAAALLLASIAVHVAALVLALFILAIWATFETLRAAGRVPRRLIAQCLGMSGVIVVAWALLYFVLIKTNAASVDVGLSLGYHRERRLYLVNAMDGFLPVLAACAAIACLLAMMARNAAWHLPFACLLASALAAIAFVFIGTKHPAHPALHPAGRLMYLAPLLCVVAVLALCWALVSSGRNLAMRSAALLCGLYLGAAVVSQDRYILETQIANRRALSLGPLYEHLARFSGDGRLADTAFVFYTHDYGTALSAARLYYGRYLWAQVYSAEELRRQASSSARLVYLEGTQDPPFRIAGFCEESQQTISLAPRPGRQDAPTVRVAVAHRC
jgi:hypothetical protein